MPPNATSIIVSRVDRLGDLVLSLPSLGFLRQSFAGTVVLHCSAYAKDVGLWAQSQGLCDAVWVASNTPPADNLKGDLYGLALFHSQEALADFKKIPLKFSLGPRSKISALWTYNCSVPQHRSQVKKSEMEYNVDLSLALLQVLQKKQIISQIEAFRGLPALKTPSTWNCSLESPHTVVVVSNSNSAANWPVEKYISYIKERLPTVSSIHALVSGHDAASRKAKLQSSGLASKGLKIVEAFPSVQELIVYLSRAKKVVSSSTGPLHIAHAAGVEVHGIYPLKKVESFKRWRPAGFWHSAPLTYEEF